MKNFLKTDLKYVITFIGLMILLLVPTIKPLFIVSFGEEVYLEVNGYDPTDPFRGDFVRLGYVESVIDKDLFDLSIDTTEYGENMHGKTVYVSLTKVGDYYQVSRVSLDKPNGIYLKAEFEYFEHSWEENFDTLEAMVVQYNLDRFYVEENTGYDLEMQVQSGNAYSVLRVLNGEAVLIDVRLK